MNTTDRILGEASKVRPPTEKELRSAYNYAKDVIKGRFPEGEEAIAKSPQWAHYYAVNVIKGRFPEAEEAIAKSPGLRSQGTLGQDYAKLYLEQFPEARLEWVMNGWLDWLDL